MNRGQQLIALAAMLTLIGVTVSLIVSGFFVNNKQVSQIITLTGAGIVACGGVALVVSMFVGSGPSVPPAAVIEDKVTNMVK